MVLTHLERLATGFLPSGPALYAPEKLLADPAFRVRVADALARNLRPPRAQPVLNCVVPNGEPREDIHPTPQPKRPEENDDADGEASPEAAASSSPAEAAAPAPARANARVAAMTDEERAEEAAWLAKLEAPHDDEPILPFLNPTWPYAVDASPRTFFALADLLARFAEEGAVVAHEIVGLVGEILAFAAAGADGEHAGGAVHGPVARRAAARHRPRALRRRLAVRGPVAG